MNPRADCKVVWLIRGAPGVGKSAVGRRLKRRLSSCAVIEVDTLRSMRADINWTDVSSHRLGLQQAADLACSFISEGLEPIIIIDTLLGETFDFLARILGSAPFIVTLIADDKILLRRARGRSSGYQDERVILEMNRWFRFHQDPNNCVIDTTVLTADEVTARILELGLTGYANVVSQSNSTANEKVGVDTESSFLQTSTVPNGRLYLVRHSDPDCAYSGPANILPGPSLSQEGINKAICLRDFFNGMNIHQIICSPFERTCQTASIIGQGLSAPIESEAWSEVGPSEPFSDVRKRVRTWLQPNLPENGEIKVVVGHGATINAAIEFFAPKDFKKAKRDRHGNIVDKAGIWLFEWRNGKLVCSGPVTFWHR